MKFKFAQKQNCWAVKSSSWKTLKTETQGTVERVSFLCKFKLVLNHTTLKHGLRGNK